MPDFKKKRIHIRDLLLDSENPRHDVLNNQPEIIKQLLDNEQILNLAKDIAEQGSLSPLETIGVLAFSNTDEYCVVEGNRRVCACQLLNNPDMAPNPTATKDFKKLQRVNTIPSEIECIIFKNREHADHWMQLRHEGQQEGIGTRPWDAVQKARYSEKMGRKNPNIQSTKIIEYATHEGLIDPKSKESFSITTLQRYLNNPHVRNIFGLKNRETLISNQSPLIFKKLVNRFLHDYDQGNVHSRSKKDDWWNYANSLQKEVADPPEQEAPYVDYGIKKKDDNPKQKLTTSRSGSNERKYLIPGDTKFSISDEILNRIYWEMKRTPIEDHEFSVAFLFRAFLERSCDLYLKKFIPRDVKHKNLALNKKLITVRDHLRDSQRIKTSKLSPLNIAINKQNTLVYTLISGYTIRLSTIPYDKELINIWDRMEETFLIIHELLN